MKIYMFLEERLKPIPEDIKHITTFDDYMLVVDDDGKMFRGESVYLEGEPQAFLDWLYPHSPVWVGKGQPSEEHFELNDVKQLH